MARSGPYTPEFREEAARLALSANKPISHTAREIGVNSETLRTWVRRHQRGSESRAVGLTLDERARLKELERYTRELEMENAFLKKAAAYFAKDPR
ncbi:transposase [Streptomyces longwoodensis]|uniref:transposase n=1 Tax=Streptomyces longwoodensis TaxID=68231 RepID=UPI0033CC5907